MNMHSGIYVRMQRRMTFPQGGMTLIEVLVTISLLGFVMALDERGRFMGPVNG